MRREIAHPWRCDRRGDCCKEPAAVVMTHQERHLIERRVMRPLQWEADLHPGFVRLLAHPCPLLEDGSCSVYDIRPFNCRRFVCGRVGDEKWDGGEKACLNLTDRLVQSLDFQEFYRANEKRHHEWAKTQGWTA